MKKYWKCLKLLYSIGNKNKLHTGALQALPMKKDHTIIILSKENDNVE